jgi:hypothetical protein
MMTKIIIYWAESYGRSRFPWRSFAREGAAAGTSYGGTSYALLPEILVKLQKSL